jgi:hypothetical protein
MMGNFLAQAGSGISGSGWLAPLLVLGALALIPASIASRKGHNGVGFYFFGLALFVPALIVALLIQEKTTTGVSTVRGTGATGASQVTWTHTGYRYLAGYTVQNPCYGIWDRQQPGPPAIRFPYTEHGKAEAWARFAELEPNAAAVVTSGVPAPPPP